MPYNAKWLYVALLILVLYLSSLYFAYNKGYNKHVLEMHRESAQIIIDSRNDVVEAVKETKDVEKNIIKSEECSVIFDFDLRNNCLRK